MCEQLFPLMKYVKSERRSRLSNEHLLEILNIALTDEEPDFQEICTL